MLKIQTYTMEILILSFITFAINVKIILTLLVSRNISACFLQLYLFVEESIFVGNNISFKLNKNR